MRATMVVLGLLLLIPTAGAAPLAELEARGAVLQEASLQGGLAFLETEDRRSGAGEPMAAIRLTAQHIDVEVDWYDIPLHAGVVALLPQPQWQG